MTLVLVVRLTREIRTPSAAMASVRSAIKEGGSRLRYAYVRLHITQCAKRSLVIVSGAWLSIAHELPRAVKEHRHQLGEAQVRQVIPTDCLKRYSEMPKWVNTSQIWTSLSCLSKTRNSSRQYRHPMNTRQTSCYPPRLLEALSATDGRGTKH